MHLITELQKHIKQKLIKWKGKIGKSRVRDYNIQLSVMNRATIQKTSKKIEDLTTLDIN